MHFILAALALATAPNHQLAMSAHHLCSGVFVVGRDLARSPEVVIEHDIKRFDFFQWGDDFEYAVDMEKKTARVWVASGPSWTAQYNGDQGCTILPQGASDVFFEPMKLPSKLPDAERQDWPTGDAGAHALVPEIDDALDWAMAQKKQYTRALVVVHKGKIIGERYAEGFSKNTPQISWSQGKSITSALIGILVHQGELSVDDRAPVSEWHGEGDPRRAIHVKHLLRMSSGLDFKNYGIDNPNSWTTENEHFRIYHDAINIFEHAVDQPLEIPPDSQFRYRNSDPLTLGRIIRQIVEARGDSYLAFPREALFDKIGARDYVLETDAYGNFIMTGYDYGSAMDWTRFGLLHLWDGVWEGERLLPEDWIDFITEPAPGDPSKGYGGLFWLNRGGALDRVPEDAYWASGFMGQRTTIIPSRDMVVVRLGPSPEGFSDYINEFIGRVLETVP